MSLLTGEQTFKILAGVGWHEGAPEWGAWSDLSFPPLVDAKLFFIFRKISLDLRRFS
jgi:hypothetical protein